MNSSTRRSRAQISSSSPRILRRLRSTPRQVRFSDSKNKKKNSNNKNDSNNSQQEQQKQQQLTTTNKELETTVDPHDKEMSPDHMINSISLSDQETTNITTNEMIISYKSPSISSSEENEDSTSTNQPSTSQSKK
jgi:hypothetical protein